MNQKSMITKSLFGFVIFLLNTAAVANPLWTFKPLTPTHLTVPPQGVATVAYQITNQSSRPKNLVLLPTKGVIQTGLCQLNPRNQVGSSCILTLRIDGSTLPKNGIKGGPVMCQANPNGTPNPNQCYQPTAGNVLNLSIAQAIVRITVTPGNLSFPSGSSGTLNVTNSIQSTDVANQITAIPPPASGIVVTGNDCPLGLSPGNQCTIELSAGTAQGPTPVAIAGTNSNSVTIFVTVTTPIVTTLDISNANLTLATQGIFTDASGTGIQLSRSRHLIITNTGINTASNVTYSILPPLPVGTSITPSSCGDIAPGDNCELTITPGNTPSAQPDNAPVPSRLTAQGTNTINEVFSDIILLTYGNRFQGGFVFAIDDTTADTLSVGGKVAAFADELFPLVWGVIAADLDADSITDGEANTSELANPFGSYPAAQTCFIKNDQGFNDWYLPAICEMGYDATLQASGCGSQVAPLIQNLFSNLEENGSGPIGGFTDFSYWSSTAFDLGNAWLTRFSDSQQSRGAINGPFPVRCIRAFSP